MERFETGIEGFLVRPAGPEDAPLLLRLIRELADYEGLLHEVVADEDTLRAEMFGRGRAEALIGEYGGEPAAFALFFHNFSTFLGRGGLYLEDLYVRPALRGKGLGKAMFRLLARLARERGCGRMEWWCLDWNAPSIAFYKSLGAEPMVDWTVYRLTGETLAALAGE